MEPCIGIIGEDPEEEEDEEKEERGNLGKTGGIKVVWGNGLKPEGTANVVGQWWKPLEPNLALLVQAA